ncbi:MAG: transporter substrate-binding domain-containing protein [Sulfitobacter sp.]
MGRNTELGLQFSLPYLFGGAPVMAHGDLGIPDATGLEGRTVCVQAGTTIERIIANYLQTNGFTTNIISYESTAELQSAYLANRCDAFAGWGRTLQCCALKKSTTLTRMSFRTINCPASRLQRPQFLFGMINMTTTPEL